MDSSASVLDLERAADGHWKGGDFWTPKQN
jgi:hypothetical protein